MARNKNNPRFESNEGFNFSPETQSFLDACREFKGGATEHPSYVYNMINRLKTPEEVRAGMDVIIEYYKKKFLKHNITASACGGMVFVPGVRRTYRKFPGVLTDRAIDTASVWINYILSDEHHEKMDLSEKDDVATLWNNILHPPTESDE